jgi:hypothetical protein
MAAMPSVAGPQGLKPDVIAVFFGTTEVVP